MGAFYHAIALDEVHALERNVQAGVIGVAQQHEFAAPAIRFNLAEAFELADAVIDVNDEVTGLELCEIAEEAGGADFLAGTLDRRRALEKIGVAQQRDLGVGKRNTFGEWGAD